MLRKFAPFVSLGLLLTLVAGCKQFGKPDDKAITTDIQAKMFADPNLKSANVNVAVKDGVVTLTGQVPDDSAHLAAYKIATEEKGVTKVNDQIAVATAPAEPEAQTAEAAPTPSPEPAPERPKRRPKHTRASESAPAESANAPSESAPPPAPVQPEAAPVEAAAPAPAPPPPPQPRTVTIPAETIITVRTIDPVDSKTNTVGQLFQASLDAPIVSGSRVVIPKGATVYMKLVNASSAGRFAGRSELTLELSSIVFQGRNYNLVTSDVKQSGGSRGQQSAKRIGAGAAIGAVIGAIAGGGKGAAIGAAVGGGAGTGVQVFTHGQQVKIPAEMRLDFTLQQPFDVTYFPGKTSERNPSAPVSQ